MAAGTNSSGNRKYSSFDYVSAGYNALSNKLMYEQFGFFIGILGPGCNCCLSKPFTDAECDCRPFRLNDEMDCGTIRRPSLKFRAVFKSAFILLQSVCNEEFVCSNSKLVEDEELEIDLLIAVDILYNFFEKKDDHEKALQKVLTDNKSSKGEIAAVFAKHLLGPLAPGRYVIDSTTSKDSIQECVCGCRSKIKYGCTGIGHEKVWHGFLDILFLSPDISLNAAALIATKVQPKNDYGKGPSVQETSTPSKKLKMEDEKNPDEQNVSEGNSSRSGYEDQAISQTIVCSMLQRRGQPELRHHLVPNIVISRDEFYIVMYDPVKDILLCTPKYPIFGDSNIVLSVPVILIFWMVLHHNLFCHGIPEHEFLNGVTSNFKLRASELLPIYCEQLKEQVSDFPPVVSTGLECDITTYYKEVSFDIQ